jgi:hypothetical protein
MAERQAWKTGIDGMVRNLDIDPDQFWDHFDPQGLLVNANGEVLTSAHPTSMDFTNSRDNLLRAMTDPNTSSEERLL